MKEHNPDTDFECDLLEDTKTFIDDMYDYQIINISNRTFNPVRDHMFVFTNKKGRVLGFTDMTEVKRYCQWLIEIGAVKVNEPAKA